MTRQEWLQKRDALAALLPKHASDWGTWSSLEAIMHREYGPCPPEEPHVMVDGARVTFACAVYHAQGRSYGSAAQCAKAITGTRDDATVRALLALRDRVEGGAK